jgi:hypothetical protein
LTVWKLPPPAKVYEAFSAVAGGRVRIEERGGGSEACDAVGRAAVTSSGGDRTYTVAWTGEPTTIASNDNASYWQGYLGYPIVAVLIALGRVRADEAAMRPLAGIDWHELNARFKRDYDAAVEHVLGGLAGRGEDRELVEREVDSVLEQLASLGLERRGRGPRPPGRG